VFGDIGNRCSERWVTLFGDIGNTCSETSVTLKNYHETMCIDFMPVSSDQSE